MRSIRPLRTLLLVAVVAVSLPVSSTSDRASAADAAGGRISLLQFPGNSLDTRLGPKVTRAAMPQLGRVFILDSDAAGAATIHPCAETPGSVPTVLFDKGEQMYVEVVGIGQCITLTTPAHLVAITLGTVTESAAPDRLQYVPLTTPRTLVDRTVTTTGGTASRSVLGIDLGVVPPEARGAVVLVEELESTSPGAASVSACNDGTTTIGWVNDRAVGLAFADLSRGDLCLWMYGAEGTQTAMRATLLGFLSTDGPDPTRLPPTVSSPVQAVRPPGFRALTPVRLLDTRQPLGIPTARKLAVGETYELSVPQAAGSSTAVALNVTVTEPDAEGFVTVFPCDQNRPKASNLNFVAGETVPNLVAVKLSVTRTVCLFTSSPAHLLVDLAGTYETDGGSGTQPVTPQRILDTREANGVPAPGKVTGGQTLVLQVAGRGGVPATGASAVTMNVTVTEPEGDGFVTVYPCDRARPTASNLNHTSGQTVPNLVSVRLSAAGTVCLFAQRTTHLLADVAAWYSITEEDGYREVAPQRVLDTREANGVPGTTRITAGDTVVLQVAGRGGVPSTGATAVTMNVTVTQPELDGFLTVYPCGAQRPTVSNLNFSAGETVPNLVEVQLAADGTVCLFAQRTLHVIADVSGYSTAVTEQRNSATVSG